jgi:hypothetical protein
MFPVMPTPVQQSRPDYASSIAAQLDAQVTAHETATPEEAIAPPEQKDGTTDSADQLAAAATESPVQQGTPRTRPGPEVAATAGSPATPFSPERRAGRRIELPRALASLADWLNDSELRTKLATLEPSQHGVTIRYLASAHDGGYTRENATVVPLSTFCRTPLLEYLAGDRDRRGCRWAALDFFRQTHNISGESHVCRMMVELPPATEGAGGEPATAHAHAVQSDPSIEKTLREMQDQHRAEIAQMRREFEERQEKDPLRVMFNQLLLKQAKKIMDGTSGVAGTPATDRDPTEALIDRKLRERDADRRLSKLYGGEAQPRPKRQHDDDEDASDSLDKMNKLLENPLVQTVGAVLLEKIAPGTLATMQAMLQDGPAGTEGAAEGGPDELDAAGAALPPSQNRGIA